MPYFTVWVICGIYEYSSVEIVQNYACKRYMCAKQNICNLTVLGDFSRFLVYVISSTRCLRDKCKILRMKDDRLVKTCYVMSNLYDESGNVICPQMVYRARAERSK